MIRNYGDAPLDLQRYAEAMHRQNLWEHTDLTGSTIINPCFESSEDPPQEVVRLLKDIAHNQYMILQELRETNRKLEQKEMCR